MTDLPRDLPPELAALAGERYVSFTTFRRSGAGVATPVWIARDGAALVFTTADTSGKVARLRRDATATLQPCDARGRVRRGTVPVRARAEVVVDADGVAAGTAAVRRAYGWQARVVGLVERVAHAVRRRPAGRSVVVRVTAAA